MRRSRQSEGLRSRRIGSATLISAARPDPSPALRRRIERLRVGTVVVDLDGADACDPHELAQLVDEAVRGYAARYVPEVHLVASGAGRARPGSAAPAARLAAKHDITVVAPVDGCLITSQGTLFALPDADGRGWIGYRPGSAQSPSSSGSADSADTGPASIRTDDRGLRLPGPAWQAAARTLAEVGLRGNGVVARELPAGVELFPSGAAERRREVHDALCADPRELRVLISGAQEVGPQAVADLMRMLPLFELDRVCYLLPPTLDGRGSDVAGDGGAEEFAVGLARALGRPIRVWYALPVMSPDGARTLHLDVSGRHEVGPVQVQTVGPEAVVRPVPERWMPAPPIPVQVEVAALQPVAVQPTPAPAPSATEQPPRGTALGAVSVSLSLPAATAVLPRFAGIASAVDDSLLRVEAVSRAAAAEAIPADRAPEGTAEVVPEPQPEAVPEPEVEAQPEPTLLLVRAPLLIPVPARETTPVPRQAPPQDTSTRAVPLPMPVPAPMPFPVPAAAATPKLERVPIRAVAVVPSTASAGAARPRPGTRPEHAAFRELMGPRFAGHLGAVTAAVAADPVLRAQQDSDEGKVELAALHAYVAESSAGLDRAAVNGFLEILATGPRPPRGLNPRLSAYAASAHAGLRRMPVHHGPVLSLRGVVLPPPEVFVPGMVLREPGFLDAEPVETDRLSQRQRTALAERRPPAEGRSPAVPAMPTAPGTPMPPHASAATAPSGTPGVRRAAALIWSESGRRIRPRYLRTDRDEVLFEPGTSFALLEVVEDAELGGLIALLRELGAGRAPADRPRGLGPADASAQWRLRALLEPFGRNRGNAQLEETR